MKKLLRFLFLFVFIFLSNADLALANWRGYVNPYLDNNGKYQSPDSRNPGYVTHDTTSVTLMFENVGSGFHSYLDPGAPIVPNACYILGKAYNPSINNPDRKIQNGLEFVNVDNEDNEEIRNSDPWGDSLSSLIVPDSTSDVDVPPESDDDADEKASTAQARFFRKGHKEGDDWYEPFWIQEPEKVDTYGWSGNDFARQAGGNLCGFSGDPIQGSGSDNPSDYVRADSEGRVWFRNLCENFEGVRTDCTEEFALQKRFRHALFRVTCGYYNPNDGAQYQEDILRGAIDSNRIPPSDKRRSYQMWPDEMCDINKANFNDKGNRELQIFENGLYEKTFGRDISEKKLWLGAFRMVFFADGDTPGANSKGSFRVGRLFLYPSFNFESKTVKTEFGEIPRDPAELATAVVRIGLGVAGGVAFLLMVSGSFRLIFARGDPEAVQQGREVLTAAVIGLLIVVFATFLLQLIGITILGFDV